MLYKSSHGQTSPVSFREAVFVPVFAQDGGMCLPETVPNFSQEELEGLSKLSYVQIVEEIASKFISEAEIPRQDLHKIVTEAYARVDKDLVSPPLMKLRPGLSVLELFHGPTICFKDIAMNFTVKILDYFLTKNNERATAIVATSGDTGGSAAHACVGLERLNLVILAPRGRCSRLQSLAMSTVEAPNIRVIEVDADSDALETIILDLTVRHPDLCKKVGLCSLNSCNWSRVLFQIPAYFHAYFKSVSQVGQPLHIVVPSGGGGNITAGCLAAKMGLPCRLLPVTNENGGLYRFFKHGRFQPMATLQTCSPAMDIQRAYNIPRVLSLFLNDCSDILGKFDRNEEFELKEEDLKVIQAVVPDSAATGDEDCVATIREVFEKFNYLVCPHTASAVHFALKLEDPAVVLATAHPAKFPDIFEQRGLPSPPEHEFQQRLEKKPKRSIDLDFGIGVCDQVKEIIAAMPS